MLNKLFIALIACSLVYGVGETDAKDAEVYIGLSGDEKFSVKLNDKELEILRKHADKNPGGLVPWNSETIGLFRRF